MTLPSALFIGMVVLAGTGGEIALTHAMKQTGGNPLHGPWEDLRIIGRAFKQSWLWLGVGLMAVAFFSFLLLLSWADVSFAVPATASSYAVGALAAKFLLREQVNKARWAGVLLVCAGVALVCAG